MKQIVCIVLVVSMLLSPTLSFSHSGGTNSAGCHNDNINGGYHCHNGGDSGGGGGGNLLAIVGGAILGTLVVYFIYKIFNKDEKKATDVLYSKKLNKTEQAILANNNGYDTYNEPYAVDNTTSAPELTNVIHAKNSVIQESQQTKFSEEINSMIGEWATAWSSKNVDKYLSFYSKGFKYSEKFKNINEWKKYRYRIIGKARKINITLSDINISVLYDEQAKATFTQDYVSPHYKDKTVKTLTLQNEKGTWKIIREISSVYDH